jgi:Cys-tRNA(Pro)/Cys-tRNA(Cys) deacylase
VVDDSASGHDTVYVSGGRRGFQVELAPDDLVRSTAGSYAAIGRS